MYIVCQRESSSSWKQLRKLSLLRESASLDLKRCLFCLQPNRGWRRTQFSICCQLLVGDFLTELLLKFWSHQEQSCQFSEWRMLPVWLTWQRIINVCASFLPVGWHLLRYVRHIAANLFLHKILRMIKQNQKMFLLVPTCSCSPVFKIENYQYY